MHAMTEDALLHVKTLDEFRDIALDLSQENKRLKKQVNYLQNKMFGRNSKKIPGDDDRMSLFDISEPQITIAFLTLFSHILPAKFADALPFYRREKQFAGLPIDLARSTMCGWTMTVADACDVIIKTRDLSNKVRDVLNTSKGPTQSWILS